MRAAINLFALVLACTAGSVLAQAGNPSRPAPPSRAPTELVAFFSGDWDGEGAFASGKPIAAQVAFRLELDGQWLQYRHEDRAPSSYKALGMWGIDSATRKLVMTLNDSGGGARTFSSEGWIDGNVTFVRTISIEPLREERFVFARLAADQFQMTYAVHVDDKPWRMVDQLVFRRTTPKS